MKRIVTSILFYLWASVASAGVPCTLPFNLLNGTTADATQVMANYNALVTCLTNAAAAGANNDITALLALSTPLVYTAGGSSQYIGGASTGAANAQVVAAPVPSGFSLVAGKTLIFQVGVGLTNSGPTTLNISGTGAINVFRQTSAGPVALSGNELVAGNLVEVKYDGTQYQIIGYNPVGWGLTTSVSGASIATINPPYGVDVPINLQLNASVGSNLLTVAVKNNAGTDPSPTNPVLIPFRFTTLNGASGGSVIWVPITAALSMNTNATGASLGCTNAVPCRLWIEAFYNAGTPVLALFNASQATAIFPLDPSTLQSTTGVSAAATSTGTFYTPNGTSLSSQPFTILGYVETTEATAGTYNVAPTKIQLFGPGIRKPGETVQLIAGPGASISITPTSNINLVKVTNNTSWNPNTVSNINCILKRNGSTSLQTIVISAATTGGDVPCSFANYLDNPATTSSTSYQATGSSGAVVGTPTYMAEEIQG